MGRFSEQTGTLYYLVRMQCFLSRLLLCAEEISGNQQQHEEIRGCRRTGGRPGGRTGDKDSVNCSEEGEESDENPSKTGRI